MSLDRIWGLGLFLQFDFKSESLCWLTVLDRQTEKNINFSVQKGKLKGFAGAFPFKMSNWLEMTRFRNPARGQCFDSLNQCKSRTDRKRIRWKFVCDSQQRLSSFKFPLSSADLSSVSFHPWLQCIPLSSALLGIFYAASLFMMC